MNKKGFTLVELLAVIVIMSIIILIAIPNVMKSLNEARKDNFGNEVNNLYSTAKTQFNLDKGRGKIKYKTVNGTRYGVYCHGISATEHAGCDQTAELSSNNTDGYKYKIMLNVEGQVVYMYITDGRFWYICENNSECSEFSEDVIVDKTKDSVNPDDFIIQDAPSY